MRLVVLIIVLNLFLPDAFAAQDICGYHQVSSIEGLFPHNPERKKGGTVVTIGDFVVATFDPVKGNSFSAIEGAKNFIGKLREHGACTNEERVCGVIQGNQSESYRNSDLAMTVNDVEFEGYTDSDNVQLWKDINYHINLYQSLGLCNSVKIKLN